MNIEVETTFKNIDKLKRNAPLLLAIMLSGFLFVDLPTEQLFGTIARCPNLVIAPFIFLFIQSCTGRIITVRLAKYVLDYSLISTITSLVMLFITVAFVTYGNWYAYAEFMPVKLLKAGAYNFLNALSIYNIYVLARFISIEKIYKILYGCVIFLTIYGLVELFVPYPIPGIHGTLVLLDEKRLQLTSAEPVTATIVYATYLSVVMYLRFYLNKNKVVSFLIALVGMILLLLIGSKGGVIFLVLSIVLSIRKKISFKIVLFGLVVIVPAIYVIVDSIIPMIMVDIEEFTSFSTRTTTWLAAFVGLVHYPFGQGFGSYLIYYPQLWLPTCKWLSSAIGIPLNTGEMEYYIQIGKYIGAKSGMPNEIVMSGVIAVVYLYKICGYQVKNFRLLPDSVGKLFFSFIFYFLFLEFLFIVTFETMYFIFIPIMVIDRILDEQKLNFNINDSIFS